MRKRHWRGLHLNPLPRMSGGFTWKGRPGQALEIEARRAHPEEVARRFVARVRGEK